MSELEEIIITEMTVGTAETFKTRVLAAIRQFIKRKFDVALLHAGSENERAHLENLYNQLFL